MPHFILNTGLAELTLAHTGRRPRLCTNRVTAAEGTMLTLALDMGQMCLLQCVWTGHRLLSMPGSSDVLHLSTGGWESGTYTQAEPTY